MRTKVWGQPKQTVCKTLSQKHSTQEKRDWQSGSSGRAPALQEWSPKTL
jgi:hypothetical protein